MRPRHVYEIANFLERSADDDSFWTSWRDTGLASCRVIEGIAFRLAREWFRCEVHPAARDAIDHLPSPIQRWFSLFASSPAWISKPGKNELWLHFCLLNNWKDKRQIALRRFFPRRGARVLHDPHVPAAKTSLTLQLRRVFFEASFLARRFLHHARAIAPTIRGAYSWRFAHSSPADRKRSPGSARL
jgi:hypothetical protein